MLKDSQPPRYSVPRTRRTYTPQFKSELLIACKQPGCLDYRLGHATWHERQCAAPLAQGPPPRNALLRDGAPAPVFIPIDLAASRPVSGHDSESSAPPSNIRIELQHHAMKVTLHWPVDAAGACAQMLRALLR